MFTTQEEFKKIVDYVERLGGEKFIIEEDSMLSIFGKMPNHNVICWWNGGYTKEILDRLKKEDNLVNIKED